MFMTDDAKHASATGTGTDIPQRRVTRRMIWLAAGILLLSGGVAILAAVYLATPGPVSGMPDVLAGLPLTHRVDGPNATGEIDRLHGKAIRVGAASIAHYEWSGTVAMLYVSDVYLGFLADRMLQAMTERMQKGDSPFAPPRQFRQAGQSIFWTLGEGQAHFFYRRGSKLVWLAADEQVAFATLAATLGTIR